MILKKTLLMKLKKKPRLIALNFENMEDIDSTGIGYLVKVRTKALENDVGLILYGIPIRILELVCIAGMDHLFTIMSKEDFTEEYLVEN
jgi:anti-anti-sigma factor